MHLQPWSWSDSPETVWFLQQENKYVYTFKFICRNSRFICKEPILCLKHEASDFTIDGFFSALNKAPFQLLCLVFLFSNTSIFQIMQGYKLCTIFLNVFAYLKRWVICITRWLPICKHFVCLFVSGHARTLSANQKIHYMINNLSHLLWLPITWTEVTHRKLVRMSWQYTDALASMIMIVAIAVIAGTQWYTIFFLNQGTSRRGAVLPCLFLPGSVVFFNILQLFNKYLHLFRTL